MTPIEKIIIVLIAKDILKLLLKKLKKIIEVHRMNTIRPSTQIKNELTKDFYRMIDQYNRPYKLEMGCKEYGKVFFLTRHYKSLIKLCKRYKKAVKNKSVRKACKHTIKQCRMILRGLQ